jgi:hypothetical protein
MAGKDRNNSNFSSYLGYPALYVAYEFSVYTDLHILIYWAGWLACGSQLNLSTVGVDLV